MAGTDMEVFFALRDRVSGGLNKIGSAFDKVSGSANAAASRVEQLTGVTGKLVSVLGTVGAALGGAALIKEVIQIGQKFEDTSIRIAGTLKAFDLAPSIGVAQLQAERAMTVIQDMAAALPGETDEYISVFATALPKVIASGLRNVTDIAKFTSSWMALASSNMVDAQQAGMDLFRMLAGQAGADVRMFTVLSEKIGQTAAEFNEMTKADPVAGRLAIQKALAAYADQQALAAETLSAKLGETQSRMKEIARLGGTMLFVQAKTILADINKWLEANKYQLIELARIWLDRVIVGFHKAVDAAKWIGEHLDTILTVSGAIVGVWVTGSLASALSNVVTLFGAIKTAAVAAQAAMTAVATASGGSFLASLPKAGLATVAAAGAAAFLLPSAGAGSKELQWEKQQREAEARESALRQKYASVISRLKEMAPGIPLQELTVGMLKELYGELSKSLVSPISDAARSQASAMRIQLAEYATIMGFDMAELTDAPALVKHLTDKKKKSSKIKAPHAPKERVTQHYDFQHSRFDIKQEFAEGFDPDRIAVAFSQDLARVGEMKVQSGYAPLFSGR